jgi:hypothetical protein
MYGDGREKTIKIIKETYEEIIDITNDMIATNKFSIDRLKSTRKCLESSIDGLIMIKDTLYPRDTNVTSTIEFIIEDMIHLHLKKLDAILQQDLKSEKIFN